MHILLATLSASNTRRAMELGALLGLIGGLAVVASTLPLLRRLGLIVGGLLLAAALRSSSSLSTSESTLTTRSR